MMNDDRNDAHQAAFALVCLALIFGSMWLIGCSSKIEPCTEGDTVMLQHAAACAVRVRVDCRDIPDNQCPAVRECDAWGRARCGIPDPVDAEATADAGSAGAQ
jgi:hypothetical protein